MDKLQDLLLTVSATLAGLCAWIVKRLWGRIDKIESDIQTLQTQQLKKGDLDKIIDIQHLILQNLLSKKRKD